MSTPSASPLDAHASPIAGSAERSGKATAAIALGVVAVLAAAFVMPLAGFALGFVAMWTASRAFDEIDTLRSSGRGLAKAGLVLGVVATLLAFGGWILNAVRATS